MRRLILCAVVVLCEVGILTANAAIQSRYDSAFDFLGTPQDTFNITLDQTNGVEWLDFSLSVNRTYNDVFADLAVGQVLYGWRYATEQDFIDLAASAGVPAAYNDNWVSVYSVQLDVLEAALGTTRQTGQGTDAVGISAESIDPGSHSIGAFRLNFPDSRYIVEIPNAASVIYNPRVPDDYSSSILGHALVRDAADLIPEPSTLTVWTLLALTFGGAGWWRRRRV